MKLSILLLAFVAVARSSKGNVLSARLKLRNEIRGTSSEHLLSRRDVDLDLLYPAYKISVPIDHFHNETKYAPHTNATFPLRYWFDASHYKEGGPVIVLQGGETDGEDRLPYLQKGILAKLAEATHGIGVILEHRYYGESFPTADLSTENLRFLTTEQALADEAFFAQHVVFEGLEDKNLTSPDVAYIGYGGSYAGGFSAFLRVLYPDVFWGAISSSGVTKAIYDYWQYWEPIMTYGPRDCVYAQEKLTKLVDNVLLSRDNATIVKLKSAFGLENVTSDNDFANMLSWPLDYYQNQNWDPEENDETFMLYCSNITSKHILYPNTVSLASTVQSLILAAGYANDSQTTTQLLNLIGYTNLTEVSGCSKTQDECFSMQNATFYQQDDITQTWRSWSYQVCTQWGYFQTGSGIPQEYPILSRLIDLNYTTIVCRDAFNITTRPNIESINKYGGFAIAYDRLAIIDGEADVWRPATPHAPEAGNRISTIEQPFILIEGGGHHWDENGLFQNETTPTLPPEAVSESQSDEIMFVKVWMEDWMEHVATLKTNDYNSAPVFGKMIDQTMDTKWGL